MKHELWMEVTSDKYELPMIVADTARALAARTGTSINTIKSNEYRYRTGKQKRSRHHRVSLDE